MRTILCVGACGFIGSNFVHYWHEKYPEDRIIIVDGFSYAASWQNLAPLIFKEDLWDLSLSLYHRNNISLIKCDFTSDYACLCLGQILDNPVNSPSVVINFFSETHVDNSIKNPKPFVDSNVTGFFNLLEACRKRNLRLYHLSTDEVLFHEAPYQRADGTYWFYRRKEDHGWNSSFPQFDPSSVYSATKACQEMLINAYTKTYNQKIDIIRLTNQYGPRQHREKLIPTVISNALEGKPIPVYKDGKQWRDWTYVMDSCNAIERIILKDVPPRVWHIAANNETQNIDVIKLILKKMNKPESLIEYVPDRLAHDYFYGLSCDMTQALGWEPTTSLDEGLLHTIRHYESIYKGS